MPIDKATGEKICINGCGTLRRATSDQPDFLAHFMPSALRHEEKELVSVTTAIGYVLDIWACPKCRYIELYDFDLRGR